MGAGAVRRSSAQRAFFAANPDTSSSQAMSLPSGAQPGKAISPPLLLKGSESDDASTMAPEETDREVKSVIEGIFGHIDEERRRLVVGYNSTKECRLCGSSYCGFGDTCAGCRKSGPAVHVCRSCTNFFKGFGLVCPECRAALLET